MRRTVRQPILLAALLFFTNSCKAPPERNTVIGPPEIEIIALVDGYMSAWDAHDAAQAAAYLTNDVVYYNASIRVPQVSRDSARKNVIQAFLTAAPDCEWTRDDSPPIIGANGVAFQWTFTGTNTGPFVGGTKATGKKFSFSGATLIRLKDGKIAYQGDYYDAHGLFKQLGLAK